MHSISCHDASGLTCDFTATGETLEAAIENLKNHGMEMHAGELQKMMAEGMTEEMMMEKIKAAAKSE